VRPPKIKEVRRGGVLKVQEAASPGDTRNTGQTKKTALNRRRKGERKKNQKKKFLGSTKKKKHFDRQKETDKGRDLMVKKGGRNFRNKDTGGRYATSRRLKIRSGGAIIGRETRQSGKKVKLGKGKRENWQGGWWEKTSLELPHQVNHHGSWTKKGPPWKGKKQGFPHAQKSGLKTVPSKNKVRFRAGEDQKISMGGGVGREKKTMSLDCRRLIERKPERQ